MRNFRPEPEPSTDAERAALASYCPSCFAHKGEWCATQAARNDYVLRLHPKRFVAAGVGENQEAPE